MLSKCVNPFCNRPFRYLSRGKLFVVEFPRRPMDHLSHRIAGREHFWLCEECARIMTVAVRRDFESVAVKIINLPSSGETKLKFVPPEPRENSEPVFLPNAETSIAQIA